MAYLLVGLLALMLTLVGQLLRLQSLRQLRNALLLVGMSSVVYGVLDLLEVPAPWIDWGRWALLVVFGYLIARGALLVLFDWLLMRRFGVEVPRLARDVVALIVYLVTAATVLHTAGIKVGALLATSAVLTVVIGLALQETLGTLLAGLALAWEQRLQTGQWVELDGVVGEVVELGWRSLIIRTRFGELLLEPNSSVARSRIRLLGRGDTDVAVAIHLGVAYGAPPDRVKELLQVVILEIPGVLRQPPPRVLTHEYADSAVVYECRLWTRQPWLDADLRDELLTRTHAALARAGMEIPFPQRTLHLARPVTVDGVTRSRQALAACALFSGLPEEALASLAEHTHWLRFAPGEVVMREGDESRSLFVLAAGAATVEREGRQIWRLDAGETCGEIAFLTGAPRNATVRAAAPLQVVEVDAEALAALLEEHRHLADELARRVARRQEQPEQSADHKHRTRAPRGLVAQLRDGLLRLVGAAAPHHDE